MKPLIIVLALAALAGCATQPASYYSYNPRYTSADGWQTVSVTPVPYGTGARVAASGDAGVTTTSDVPTYVPPPATTTVVTQPVYVAPPLYAPAPYVAPAPSYWWPPISIGLGFSWGHWSGGHGGGWHGGHGGGWHRGGGGPRHR